MKGRAQRIYNASPIWIQNLAVTVAGLRLRHLRYGSTYQSAVRDLRDSETWSPNEVRDHQEARLRILLQYAARHVPYYRNLFEHVHLDGVTLSSFHKLVPVLPRATVRDCPEAFRSDEFRVQDLVELRTSGTTGTPLSLRATRDAIQHNYAHFSRFLSWHGVAPGDSCATLAGRIVVPIEEQSAPYWRTNAAMNQWLYSTYHIAPSTVPAYVRGLNQQRPVYIDSYPSAVSALAEMALAQQFSLDFRPKIVVTSSETLLDHQRDAIEEFFGCPVRDQYGNVEMAAWIGQCEQGSYHAAPEYGLLEVLDESGQPQAPGKPGDVCLTGFINPAMPLIRYMIGDVAEISQNDCPCGRPFPAVEAIHGRRDDMIVTPDGRRVGRLGPVFKSTPGLIEGQIVQRDANTLIARLVLEPGCPPNAANDFLEALRGRVGHRMQIRIEYPPRIERTAAGKLRPVINLWK